MKKVLLILVVTSTMTSFGQTNYPKTEKKVVDNTYFGTTIHDPYRWLEDDKSAETASWVKAENEVTFNYLEKIPFRKQLKERMEKLWNYEKISAPFKRGNYTYYYKNNGLQNQSVLYRKDKNGKEEVFLDPNTFSADGSTSLASISFTKDGSLVAYAVSEAGSDWNKIIILNAITNQKLEAELVDVKFSGIAWIGNEGFYYSSYDKPTGNFEVDNRTTLYWNPYLLTNKRSPRVKVEFYNNDNSKK